MLRRHERDAKERRSSDVRESARRSRMRTTMMYTIEQCSVSLPRKVEVGRGAGRGATEITS